MKAIDLNEQISRKEFQDRTIKMLAKKGELDEINTYKDEPETLTNYFVKDEYKVTTNQDSLEEKTLLNAKKKHSKYTSKYTIITGIIGLVLYCIFYALFPIISKNVIEDGWLFMMPMILMIVTGVLHTFSIDKFAQCVKIQVSIPFV